MHFCAIIQISFSGYHQLHPSLRFCLGNFSTFDGRYEMNSKIIMATVVVSFLFTPVLGDWDPGDFYKCEYLYLPDLTEDGRDVNASLSTNGNDLILADDFLCSETGPITDIHIWGSWKDDVLPEGSAANVDFYLAIYDNDNGGPGDLLWSKTFTAGQFQTRMYAYGLQEGWMEPNSGEYTFPGDTQCWQYNFYIDEAEAFVQEWDEHYWLAVMAFPSDDTAKFGWKTTPRETEGTMNSARWNVDMTPWDDTDLSLGSSWTYLAFQEGEPAEWVDIDFAFVITPEPASLILLGMGGLAILRRKK